jgi:hypothetical protein
MATKSKSSFQKRQKEMKRQEKQRMKAERRAQKKLTNRAEREGTLQPAGTDVSAEGIELAEGEEPAGENEPLEPQA